MRRCSEGPDRAQVTFCRASHECRVVTTRGHSRCKTKTRLSEDFGQAFEVPSYVIFLPASLRSGSMSTYPFLAAHNKPNLAQEKRWRAVFPYVKTPKFRALTPHMAVVDLGAR